MNTIPFSDEIKQIDTLFQQSKQLQAQILAYCSSQDTGISLHILQENWLSFCQQAERMSIDLTQLSTLASIALENGNPDQLQKLLPLLNSITSILQKKYVELMRDENQWSHVLLKNILQTTHSKKALLAYIIYPFLFPDSSSHTNQQEAQMIAQALSDHGYQVDVCSHLYQRTIPNDYYDLILGYGQAIDTLCNSHPGEPVYYYLTESCPYFANPAEIRRHEYFHERNHCDLPLERQNHNFLSLHPLRQAKGALCIGNQVTSQTYEGIFRTIYPINASGFVLDMTPDDLAISSPRDFLWYGGAGPIHKGLDLLIEAFRQLPELNLHIVGHLHQAFYDFYRKDLEEAANIFYYDFLHKDDPLFLQVCQTCAYCVSPSCSEGQSTSVLTAMFGGVIPVCTLQNGIDLERCGGHVLADYHIEAIIPVLRELSTRTKEDILATRIQCYEYVHQYHTLESYYQQIYTLISTLNVSDSLIPD